MQDISLDPSSHYNPPRMSQTAARRKEWLAENAGRMKNYWQRNYLDNRDKALKRAKDRYWNDPEAKHAYDKDYRLKPECQAREKERDAYNEEQRHVVGSVIQTQGMWMRAKERAKRLGVPFTI